MNRVLRVLRWLRWPLVRWANAAALAEVEDLQRDLRLQAVKVEALTLERDSLAAVVVRDRQRVQAETMEMSGRIARAGG